MREPGLLGASVVQVVRRPHGIRVIQVRILAEIFFRNKIIYNFSEGIQGVLYISLIALILYYSGFMTVRRFKTNMRRAV